MKHSKMKCEDIFIGIVTLIGLVFQSPHADASQTTVDFNQCRELSYHSERMNCLDELSRQIEQQNAEVETDSLTKPIFKDASRQWARRISLLVNDGMILEEPNDFSSGQYFAVVGILSASFENRRGLSFDLSLPYSKFTSTGVDDPGVKRLGRPAVRSQIPLSQEKDSRLSLTMGARLPLVSGDYIGDSARYWGIELGVLKQFASKEWRYEGWSGLRYDAETIQKYTVKNGGTDWVAGRFQQHPLLLDFRFQVSRGRTNSVIFGVFGSYSLISGRTITTNDPNVGSLHSVTDDSSVRLVSADAGYNHRFSDQFETTIRIWKSLINQFVGNDQADVDVPSYPASLGVEGSFSFWF